VEGGGAVRGHHFYIKMKMKLKEFSKLVYNKLAAFHDNDDFL
jgi:hypothetical protein